MVETVGKKLRQARQRKQISIEEASHETKIRQEQITALEGDDFTNFPNITYARGFLVIYAKYLGVDVSEYIGAFENPNPVGSTDYEYLSNKPAPVNSVSRVNWKLWRPVIIASVVLILGIIIVDFVINVTRINIDQVVKQETAQKAEAAAATPAPDAPKSQPLPSPAPAESPAETPAPIVTGTATATPAAVTMLDHTEVRRAEPVAPSDLLVPAMSSPTPSLEKTVTLQPISKTWVKITRNVPGSPPVFEDWLFPDARPLSFKGTKFWIEIRDKDAVKITRDGQPVPYEPPGVTIE